MNYRKIISSFLTTAVLGLTFTLVGATSAPAAQSNGALDLTFNSNGSGGFNSGFDGSPRELAIQSDGKVIAVGPFTTYNGFAANGIVRINTDGSIDQSFDTGTGFLAPTTVAGVPESVSIAPDGSIYVVGQMTSYNGQIVSGIVKLDSTGILDTTFSTNLGRVGGRIFAVTATNSYVIFGGSVNGVGSTTTPVSITGITRTGTSNTYTAASHGYTVGDVVSITGVSSATPAHHNVTLPIIAADANTFTVSGSDGGAYSSGGQVTKMVAVGRIAKASANGTLDSTFNSNIGTGFSNDNLSYVFGLAFQSSDGLIVTGSFDLLNGTSIPTGISRIGTDGTRNSTASTTFHSNAGTGLIGYGTNVVQDSQGRLILAGSFSGFNGVSSSRLVKVNADGSRDTSFVVGTGLSTPPWRSMDVAPDDSLLFASSSTNYGGVSVPSGVLKLNNNGSRDSGFTAAITSANATAVLAAPNGDVYLAGNFTAYDGKTVGRIVRLTYLAPTVANTPASTTTAPAATATPAAKLATTGTDLAPFSLGVTSALLISGLILLTASKRLRRKN